MDRGTETVLLTPLLPARVLDLAQVHAKHQLGFRQLPEPLRPQDAIARTLPANRLRMLCFARCARCSCSIGGGYRGGAKATGNARAGWNLSSATMHDSFASQRLRPKGYRHRTISTTGPISLHASRARLVRSASTASTSRAAGGAGDPCRLKPEAPTHVCHLSCGIAFSTSSSEVVARRLPSSGHRRCSLMCELSGFSLARW